MRLRLGVGGKAFGVRGGISNRGFGVGAGPVSVASSWRRRRRRSRRSSGGADGWFLLLIIGLVVAGVNSLFGDTEQPHTAAPGGSAGYSTQPSPTMTATTETTSVTTSARTTTRTTPTTAAPSALKGLLLGPAQIDSATGATGMRVAKTYTTMKNLNAYLPDQVCLPLADSADAAVYARSGVSDMRGQGLDDPDIWTHRVYQNVVSFSSPH